MRWCDRLLAAALAFATVSAPALPAAAAPIGRVTVRPATSIDTAPIVARTSGGCPARADTYYAVAKGHGFPKDGQVVTTPTAAGLSHAGAFDVYFAETMKDFAADNHTTLSGRYEITVFCADSFTLNSYGEFTGALTFTSATRYVTAESASAAPPPSAAPVSPAPRPSTAASPAPGSSSAPPVLAPAAAPPPPPASDGVPVVWIVLAALAGTLLVFEAGRRVGRAQR